jgi:hypothetical protein
MNIKYIPSLLLLLFSIQLSASNDKHDKFKYDKYKSEKVAFITQAIELTPQEAEKFWPVYNEFEKKRWEQMNNRHEQEKSLQDTLLNMSDKDYIDLSRQISSSMANEGKIMQEYNEKFLELLPPKKVVALYIAELKFRRQLLKEYRNKDKEEEKDTK